MYVNGNTTGADDEVAKKMLEELTRRDEELKAVLEKMRTEDAKRRDEELKVAMEKMQRRSWW